MEFKTIIYIIGGILYLIYQVKKQSDNAKENAPQKATHPAPQNTSQPTKQKVESVDSIEDLLRKIEQSKPTPKPKQQTQTKTKGRDILIHEIKKTKLEEGKSDFAPTYSRDLTDEEKIMRGDLSSDEANAYKIDEVVDEQQVESFQVNARQAIIGSIIFERKF